jgi:hypothetical protein
MRGGVSNGWNGGGEGSVPSSVVAPAPDRGRGACIAPRALTITPEPAEGSRVDKPGGDCTHPNLSEGRKPGLVRALGAIYHAGELQSVDGLASDIIMECTGAPTLIAAVPRRSASCGVVCLTGVSAGGGLVELDTGGLNRTMMLQNHAVFGTVNANRAHYRAAADVLAKADRDWRKGLISRRIGTKRSSAGPTTSKS